MDVIGVGAIFGAMTSAISVLFWMVVKERDKRETATKEQHAEAIASMQRQIDDRDKTIAKQDEEIDTLKARVDRQSAIIEENTAALVKAADSQERVVSLLGDFLKVPGEGTK